MDLRTFLRPAPVQVQLAPRVGDLAPETPLLPRSQGQPCLVAFLRHVGCPFAEATMQRLRELSLAHPEIECVAVTHAREEATRRWCAAVGGAGRVRLVVDEGRALYGAWGLGLTSLGHFLGGRSLRGVLRLSARGIRNRHPVGTRWQMAGTFAVDGAGIVRWRHLPAHAGDLPDLEQALAALAPGADRPLAG